jgi:hypothetical protein
MKNGPAAVSAAAAAAAAAAAVAADAAVAAVADVTAPVTENEIYFYFLWREQQNELKLSRFFPSYRSH